VKCGARIAMGVAGGYFLGRTKKMKLALMLGGWAAGRQLGGPGQIFGQASRMLGESPELSALTDQVRGRLLEAGKDAAMAVATRRVEALTDRVGQRVEELADVRRVADPDVRRAADVGDLDIASRNGEEEEDFEEEEEQPAPPTRARTSDSRAARTSGNSRAAAGSRSGNSRAAAGSRSGNSRAAAGSRSAGASRSSANTRAVGGKRSSDQRSSSSSGPKAASSTSPRSKSSTRTQTAKKGATSSSRTPKKAGAGRKASRTAPTQREDSNG
jgi:hypothetical protein